MDQMFEFKDLALCSMVRRRHLDSRLECLNPVLVEHWRDGQYLATYETYNDIVNVGKNDIFNVYFHSGTQTLTANWFMGLISSSGFTGLAATDIMSSHTGWTEFVGYSGGVRPGWGPSAAASQSITNPSATVFNITGSGTINGVFIVNDSTLSGTSGTLWATALFSVAVPVDHMRQQLAIAA